LIGWLRNHLLLPSGGFSNAEFTYDGDGRRVKSVIATNVGSTTTYFVGSHYEVTGTSITKYYFAGTQRIAMRKDTTLYYLLSDHLGSTSLVTDAAGTVISQTRYKAWGEVRHQSGVTPTEYQYTSQYSYAAEFGLLFYNARIYDPALKRFISADTIVPPGVQGLDRYSYVNNSPVNYVDPSGHEPGACQDSALVNGSWVCNPTPLQTYGISTDGLNEEEQQNALDAASYFGQYYYQNYGVQYGFTSPQDAFKKLTGGNITIILDDARDDCITVGSIITCDAGSMTMKAFVHEYFHVFDKYYQSKGVQNTAGCGGACLASNNLPFDYYTNPSYTAGAYKCDKIACVSHPDWMNKYNFTEAFANASENLVLGALQIDPANNGFKDIGTGPEVQGWMNDWMPTFINGVVYGGAQ
jgi:RHS repeat-associated protein